ncbi:MAG: peptidoglycan DD-metalloendopeptidase family protein [Candidatus Gracilibacteria bacterium]
MIPKIVLILVDILKIIHEMVFDVQRFGFNRGFKPQNKERAMKWLTAAMALLLAGLTMVVCNAPEEQREFTNIDQGGGDYEFKVPVPKGYDWEISQSWKDHCEECDERYPGGTSFCEDSHSEDCCEFGWDFNLPGDQDRGKPVLATADGVVKFAGESDGWGNTVLVDHGNDLCSRYAHMLDDSIMVEEDDEVCQGLKLGEIGETGFAEGEHLHFQFEDCRTHEVLERGFSDGNGVPICVLGSDRYDEDGDYVALELTNDLREECDSDEDFGDGELPEGGWREAECGSLSGCPLRPNCGREAGHKFEDNREMDKRTRDAVAYLYSECAVDGKADGDFDPNSEITRAEALKISMYLFDRIDEDCEEVEDFRDVYRSDWFYNLVNCGIEEGAVDGNNEYFRPNEAVTFAEAAKMAVVPAVEAGVIRLQNPSDGHFPLIPESHWAYRYVETLYHYGALVTDASYYGPDDTQSRRQFAIIAASLSPCFCANVSCEYPCECRQETFSCTDPEDEDPGEGGGDDDDEGSEDDDESDDDGEDDDVDDDEDDDADDDVDDDDEETTTTTTTTSTTTTTVSTTSSSSTTTTTVPDENWDDCNPGDSYTLNVYSPWGYVEYLTSSNPPKRWGGQLPPDGLPFLFHCEDFPIAVLVTAAADYTDVGIRENFGDDYVLMEGWVDYVGELTAYPEAPRDFIALRWFTDTHYTKTLMRWPMR